MPFQGVAEADLEAPPGALVAMDGGGEDQAGVGQEQGFQQRGGDGRGLVDQEQVGGFGVLAEGVRGQKAQFRTRLAEVGCRLGKGGWWPGQAGGGMAEQGLDGAQAGGR